MFYTYLRGLVAFILWVLNGNAHYHHKDNIPDREENYILVSPHRTWWDPVFWLVDSYVWGISDRP